MIGELINKFDKTPSSNVLTFNTIFNTDLGGSILASVEIGSLVRGNTREVFVNGERRLVELSGYDLTSDRYTKVPKRHIYKLYSRGKFVKNFYTMDDIAEFTKTPPTSVKTAVAKKKTFNNIYKVDKVINQDFIK